MNNEVLIKVEGVSKKFCRNLKKSLIYGGSDIVNSFLGMERSEELRKDEFWALNNVNFEVKRGECLGLIGRNGAGKTTLLKILNGLIRPDTGKIEITGKVGAMLALGAGFNPLLTGRENIYINGTILGLSKKEIDDKLDEIIDFSEINDFIDSPVQSYSSGMYVRLGFSVASILKPDILILDEVLAVGDTAFRYKCYKKIDEMRDNAAVIFVTHDMPNVARICDRTMVMSKGIPVYIGNTQDGINKYNFLNEDVSHGVDSRLELVNPITDFCIHKLPTTINFKDSIDFEIEVISDQVINNIELRINLLNQAGSYAASAVVESYNHCIKMNIGVNKWEINVSTLPLKNGKYFFVFGLANEKGKLLAISHKQHEIIIEGGHAGVVADCQLNITDWNNI